MQKVQEAPSLGEKLFPAAGPLGLEQNNKQKRFLEKNTNYPTPIKILQTMKF